MNMMELARKVVKDVEKDNALRESENLCYVDMILARNGKKFRVAKDVPEMVKKIEDKCEVICRKCVLHGNACDGSLREIASCNDFKNREIEIVA